MAKKDQPRDWDKELAEVDRLLNQLPTHREEQMAAAAPKRPPAAAPAGMAQDGEARGWGRGRGSPSAC